MGLNGPKSFEVVSFDVDLVSIPYSNIPTFQLSSSFSTMKILTFTTLYPNNIWPNQGVFIKERMTHVGKLDECEIRVVSPVPYFPSIKIGSRWLYSQVARQEMRDGLEVYHPRYFMTPKIGMSLYGLMMFWSVLPTVRQIQKEFDFDLIDAHYVYPDGFAGVLLGRFFRKPVVVSARGSDINLYSNLRIIRKLVHRTLDRADKVIAVSNALKEKMVRLGVPEGKVSVVPNGVRSEQFYPVPREEARKKLNLSGKRVILSIGHLTPNKGFDLLVRSVRVLQTDLDEKNLLLIIVGEGKFRNEIEKTVSSLKLNASVRLAGAIPHEELRDWYCAADIFCLASQQEGWPNVILESFACGTPVVATPTGGIPEIISSNGIGMLSERTEQDFAQKISVALKKAWKRDEMVKFARKHTWDRVAQSVYDVFQSVLDNSRPGNVSSVGT